MDSGITLDPEDPFEGALIGIVETNRRKRADYSLEGRPFSNFKITGDTCGLPHQKVVEVMIAVKGARLQALEASGLPPQNESVEDTLLDRAVYSIIAYAMSREGADRWV